jgi:hypothetical protein
MTYVVEKSVNIIFSLSRGYFVNIIAVFTEGTEENSGHFQRGRSGYQK